MWKRIWTLFLIRNKEFYRDKSALGWNFLFPFLIIIGFNLMFNQENQHLYKVGVLGSQSFRADSQSAQFKAFRQSKYIEFIEFASKELAVNTLKHHRIDLVLDPVASQYWVSDSSPKGYVVEKILISQEGAPDTGFIRQNVQGRELPYVEWLFPGILGMNMMFSSLFGVGYVVVRYRKNGVLKRLSVTPVTPFEFLAAQVISRMFLLLMTTFIIFTGCTLLYGFECRGSYLDLLITFTLGGFCMVALGLLIATRSSSEEFAEGLLNLLTWPMMFLAEVWFSLEGATPWVKTFAKIFPLTHMIDCVRQIMNDGAGLYEIRYQLATLTVMSVIFMAAGSWFFKWQKD